MRCKFKRSIASIIALTMFISFIPLINPIPVYAEDDMDNTGNGSGSVHGTGTYSQNQEGYRITIVDKDFNAVSNSVDITYSNPPEGVFGGYSGYKDIYINSRTQALTSAEDSRNSGYMNMTFKQLGQSVSHKDLFTTPNPPIYSQAYDGKLTEGGTQFKSWFAKGSSQAEHEASQDKTEDTHGTTKPTTGNVIDMSAIIPQLMISSWTYRLAMSSQAYNYTVNQGYIKHANKILTSEIYLVQQTVAYFRMKGVYSEVEIQRAALASELQYVLNVSYTNAEAIYMYGCIINNVFGNTFEYGQKGIGAYSNNTDISNKSLLASNQEELGNIPLASNNADISPLTRGWLTDILNVKGGGKYIFQFKSNATNISTKYSPLEDNYISLTARASGYYILVEPVFWLKPKIYGGADYKNWVYGTYSNFIDFFAIHGEQYATNYVTVFNKMGWQCMYYNTKLPGTNFPTPFNAVAWANTYGDKQSLSDLKKWKDNKDAFGMHIYNLVPDMIAPSSQITGENSWTYPSSAPDSNPKVQTFANGVAKQFTQTGELANADGTIKSPDEVDSTKAYVAHNDDGSINYDYKFPPEGYNKEYNIVKYYEDIMPDGSVEQAGRYLRKNNPPNIAVIDEKYYKVKGWFTTSDDLGNAENNSDGTYKDSKYNYESYVEAKSKMKAVTIGDGATSKSEPVKLDTPNPSTGKKIGEKTLVVLLQKQLTTEEDQASTTLSESRISKAITTADTSITNWGLKDFTFIYASMSNSDTHNTYSGSGENRKTHHHSCSAVFGDSSYSYFVDNKATLDNTLETNVAGGDFSYVMVNNTMSGSASISGGTNVMKNVEYKTAIWRGEDIPTIASYKEDSSNAINKLTGRYGSQPQGDRHVNGSYVKTLSINLDTISEKSDLETHSVHSYNGNTWVNATHTWLSVAPFTTNVEVKVYRGDNIKEKGDTTSTSKILTSTPFGNASSINSSGYMVQQDVPIQFYPYVRMSYQTVGQTDKTNVNVLSQFVSYLLPNSFGEAAWYNSKDKENLTLTSNQWSLSARAVSGGKDWNGYNQVLPGGAIYQLTTEGTESKVALNTWQPIIPSSQRSALATSMPINAYSESKADVEHSNYVEQAKQVIEGLRVVQWVNSDTSAQNAWSGTSKIKIDSGGKSLGAIGLSGSTSTESKYRLLPDGSADAANEGDLDVESAEDSTKTYFKVFSDTKGNVYLAKNVGNLSALESINGDNIGNAQKILSQTNKVSDIDSKLSGDAKELEKRTSMISNFVKTIERNTGHDFSSDVSNGHWYNEAWDGVYLVRQSTMLTVGFSNTPVRTSVIDTNLCPVNDGVSDLYSKAYLSQFRCEEKSDASIAKDRGNGYIGTFQGKDIYLENMANMYNSKKFYIPNVNVQDLGN